MTTNDYELGKLIGQLEALTIKIDNNTKCISKMESCMYESKREGRDEIVKLRKEINDTNDRLDSINDKLSMYSTTIKVVKTIFYAGVLLLTFKLGDVRDLIGSIWK